MRIAEKCNVSAIADECCGQHVSLNILHQIASNVAPSHTNCSMVFDGWVSFIIIHVLIQFNEKEKKPRVRLTGVPLDAGASSPLCTWAPFMAPEILEMQSRAYWKVTGLHPYRRTSPCERRLAKVIHEDRKVWQLIGTTAFSDSSVHLEAFN